MQSEKQAIEKAFILDFRRKQVYNSYLVKKYVPYRRAIENGSRIPPCKT